MRLLELRIPPLVVVAAAALLMWLIARGLPALHIDLAGTTFAAAVLWCIGIIMAAAGVLEFRRARTTTNPLAPQDASTLVTGGVYRFSRNPMYVGFVTVLLGWAVFLSNPAVLIVVLACVCYLTRFQIVPEERVLEKTFGPEFEAYRRAVRRWL